MSREVCLASEAGFDHDRFLDRGRRSPRSIDPCLRPHSKISVVNIVDRIQRSIANLSDDVVVRSELKSFGSPSQVGLALRGLIDRGFSSPGVGRVRESKPVCSQASRSRSPVEVLGPQALTKFGVKFELGHITKSYNSGASTKIPSGVVLNTGDRRVTRKIGFNGKYIEYERRCVGGRPSTS